MRRRGLLGGALALGLAALGGLVQARGEPAPTAPTPPTETAPKATALEQIKALGGFHDLAMFDPFDAAADTFSHTTSPSTLTFTYIPSPAIYQFITTGPGAAVVLWYGDPKALPRGFVACDGRNGTTDLRHQFLPDA